jgi:uncharacterized protein
MRGPPLALLIFAVLTVAGPAMAQTDRKGPSFDCAGVYSRVQMTICNSTDLSQLDRDLARYVLVLKTVLSDQAARRLEASQAAWERARDSQCNRVIGEIDPDGPVYRCLMTMYRARLVQLAIQNDHLKGRTGPAISGYYRYAEEGATGEMWVIGWPDGFVTVLIDTLALPDAPTCAFRMETIGNGTVIDGYSQYVPECKVQVTFEGRTAAVDATNCGGVCVMSGHIDGIYRR